MKRSDKITTKIKEGFLGQKMVVLPPNVKKNVQKDPLTNRFYFTAIGFYPHASFHSRERKAGCSQYILLYCTSGRGRLTIRNAGCDLGPNEFVILPKHVPHNYSSSKDDPWTIYWLHFAGEAADFLFERYVDLGNPPLFIVYDQSKIDEFNQIFSLLSNSFDLLTMEFVNIRLTSFLSSFIYARQINPLSPDADKISLSVAYMKQHLDKQFLVKELANQQNLSITHYSRLFHEKTGSSPNNYMNELKIQQSCQYLYFTNMSIKEICIKVGISDQYYFSRLFKKLMGMSPTQYKTAGKKS